MFQHSKLLAWIEPRSGEEFVAAFVSAPAATQRSPATRVRVSPDAARRWVEQVAVALDLPVEWVSAAPGR